MWQRFRDQGVVVIGINTGGLYGGDDAVRIRRFIDETGATFPVVEDRAQRPVYDAGPAISPFPLDIVVGRDGRIVYLAREYDADALSSAVDMALSP